MSDHTKHPTRAHHAVERFQGSVPQRATSKALRLDGDGIVLGTSKKISSAINALEQNKLVNLHRLFYGSAGVAKERLMNVLAFCGLEQANQTAFDKNVKRVTGALEKKTDEEIDELVKVFAVKVKETRNGKIEDILNFVITPLRPNCDEQIEFKDETFEEMVEEGDEEPETQYDGLDASSDEGEVYNEEDEEDDDDKPIKKTKTTKKGAKTSQTKKGKKKTTNK
ncbi:hypothetical protein EIN_031040 [Entamoeba invadens IP1]|uniref:DEK C-terminal domain-containing protein n=1 Tax=Entamoeba invadens IP1 TaxID=370355 RepID=A0A0A1U1D9_ENTIV|nr:hypothetical protein EIN_031040 [Entamoeba invadens IP1]ELP86413.1 hypothetical protein EIN_031040 [Entamoeba invadens IP1]|eukprot:XP_004185759.1 hypothetical protein EIN_031040 [Entamoeba invadens IP1]